MTDTIDLKGIEWIPVSKENCFKIHRGQFLATGQQEPYKDRIITIISGSGFCYKGVIYHKDIDYMYISLR